MIGIHDVHRKLATVAYMNIDQQGNFIVGEPEIKLILRLLRENLELIIRLDLLKELSCIAYELQDWDWQMDICAKIEALEAKMI